MFDKLTPAPKDAIIALMENYKSDPRAEKIDLGVGVYKNETGITPIMGVIKTAEQRLWQSQTTKTYTSLAGAQGFTDAMRDLVLGNSVDAARVAAVATPGGTGAVHNIFELILSAKRNATLWVSNPTWANHVSIANYVALSNEAYRYFDASSCRVDFDNMLADLQQAQAGDVVLLHGCCHNPTGANLNQSQWQHVADLLLAKQAIPMIDIAYQGFGEGLQDDAYGVRLLAQKMPEMLVAASCSKNFGLYRDRVGVIFAITKDSAQANLVQGKMNSINRLNYSFPPDHGAALVDIVLNDDSLRQEWQDELETMRQAMLNLRQALGDALRIKTNSDRFDFITQHRGMFSRIGITQQQVERLRKDYAIYMVSDSRINIAGVTLDKVEYLAQAIADVIR